MIAVDSIYNVLDRIGQEVSMLFNDHSKQHEIIIKLTPEEVKKVNKGISLHILKTNVIMLGKPHDEYKFIQLQLPYGVKIKFEENGEETTN
jgi:hypothetical protein